MLSGKYVVFTESETLVRWPSTSEEDCKSEATKAKEEPKSKDEAIRMKRKDK